MCTHCPELGGRTQVSTWVGENDNSPIVGVITLLSELVSTKTTTAKRNKSFHIWFSGCEGETAAKIQMKFHDLCQMFWNVFILSPGIARSSAFFFFFFCLLCIICRNKTLLSKNILKYDWKWKFLSVMDMISFTRNNSLLVLSR